MLESLQGRGMPRQFVISRRSGNVLVLTCLLLSSTRSSLEATPPILIAPDTSTVSLIDFVLMSLGGGAMAAPEGRQSAQSWRVS